MGVTGYGSTMLFRFPALRWLPLGETVVVVTVVASFGGVGGGGGAASWTSSSGYGAVGYGAGLCRPK